MLRVMPFPLAIRVTGSHCFIYSLQNPGTYAYILLTILSKKVGNKIGARRIFSPHYNEFTEFTMAIDKLLRWNYNFTGET